MTQTTSAMNTVDGQIEYSLNSGSSYTDMSGVANKLSAPSVSRATGEKYTPDGDTPIIKAGKQQPIDINIDVLYEDGAADEFALLYAAFLAKTSTIIRWSPGGGDVGDAQFTSSEGFITSCTLPNVDPEEAGPHTFSMTVRVASVARATIAA